MTRLAVAQLELSIEDPGGNWRAVESAVAEAAADGVEILVLPELTTTGYVFADAAEATASAESITGPTVTALSALSATRDLLIVAGWCEASGADRPYNSAVVVDGGSVVANYRKTHLWGGEKLIFTPGAERPPVLETRFGRIAICICYDVEFPELVRDLALRGAQLIATPVNWPALEPRRDPWPTDVTKTLSAAATNRLFVAVADRCGTERGVPWNGASVIAGPDGYPRVGPAAVAESCLLVADLDLGEALDKRLGEHNDVFADRRPELYR